VLSNSGSVELEAAMLWSLSSVVADVSPTVDFLVFVDKRHAEVNE